MIRLLAAVVVSAIVLSNFPLPAALGQGLVLPTGERFSLVLPRDPFKWEPELNDLGQKGWDAIMAQQPGVGGLILHFVIFTKTPGVRAVDYKVVVAEFPTGGDPSALDSARGQLEIQANGYGRNGWTLLQALTNQHPSGKSYIALILKKPLF
jgi:hypothetical protein